MTTAAPRRLDAPLVAAPPTRRRRSRWISITGITAIVGVAVLLTIAVIGPGIWTEAATVRNIPERWATAGAEHLFGTDDIGRDIFARVMVAARTSLLLTAGATAMLIGGGLVIGLTAAILPKRPRRALIWVMDMLLAFPWLLLVLFFTVIWGATAVGAMLAIGLAGIPNVTRLVYNMASSVTEQDYVRAARVVGVGPFGIMVKHVLPNIANPLLVQAAAAASTTLLAFAGLSFLGLGVQAPEYDWGRLLDEGLGHLYTNPMAAIGPGIFVVFAALVFTMIAETIGDRPGEGLRAVAKASRTAVLARRAAAAPSSADHRAGAEAPLAEVRGLHVSFPDGEGGVVERVHGVDLRVEPGEVVGIVGESGSGKSLTAMALAGLLDSPAIVEADTRRFEDIDLDAPLTAAARKRLGVEIGVIFQDPLTSLNPALTIGRQLTEVPQEHLGMSRVEARKAAVEGLEAVRIPDPADRLRDYPHQFSGGMRQRAMIGMALTGRPRLIIADEPTTALDVTVQRQVLAVLQRAQRATGAGIVFISHDIALVSGFCDRVVVMKDGRIVEELDAEHIKEQATHPYTQGLIACLPNMRSDRTQPLPVISEDLLDEGAPATGDRRQDDAGAPDALADQHPAEATR
ncbi:dipeptide/oligopeptide/nickel ABC transporter permease/ATP-binding protein [Microbacterium marinilacus]|uniref:Dipeptide/oligopeptide/nickel ABC transporter permease/ATP-binding protein n=1 Tax=Microbacterium marinilacus TaxID=415209 RepID=A0ABP7BS41_9MICO|nr:dipeptide/oligopeptide/nickel ABC transporter permease/ATP-binding protein [Microbacterium marinilacus]MBY0690268.1 dipeptide/oligopeptide/nickel ABC transporter permease/ATP-binding protein [Microbacterium marinilacus]